MDAFKLPQNIPQDLLLISDLVGAPEPAARQTTLVKAEQVEDDISSSDSESENASEDEIEAELIAIKEDEVATKDEQKLATVLPVSAPSDSSSDSESDTSSDDDDSDVPTNVPAQDLDDDEDPVSSAATGTYFQTKHETVEAEIKIPDIDEVGQDEVLEKVGEVMNIMDNVVIIKCLPSDTVNRGSDRALDSDTLLVFDDRKVLGYIFETFGPTSQPLYQVKFNSSYPLNPERVTSGRNVFHVPARSHFVFLSQIKALKGSDASNVHDEEPAEEELEFSDDEAEAMFRSRLKRKRGESRARSVASSRHGSPTPSQMRDQDLVDHSTMSGNAYDARGPYDFDFSAAGPSRPPPIPYDDPYSDAFNAPEIPKNEPSDRSQSDRRPSGTARESGRDRSDIRAERGDRRGYNRDNGRGRGRGRGRGEGGRGRGISGYDRRGSQHGSSTSDSGWSPHPTGSMDAGPSIIRPLSPTSLAIARATGQSSGQVSYASGFTSQPFSQNGDARGWGHNQSHMQAMNQQYGYGQQGFQQPFMQMPFVQPHINPRFASAFGMGYPGMQPQMLPQNSSFSHPAPTPSNVGASGGAHQASWTDEWTVSVGDRSEATSGDGSKNNGQ